MGARAGAERSAAQIQMIASKREMPSGGSKREQEVPGKKRFGAKYKLLDKIGGGTYGTAKAPTAPHPCAKHHTLYRQVPCTGAGSAPRGARWP